MKAISAAWIGAIGIAIVMGQSTLELREGWNVRVEQQRSETRALRHWAETYEELQPIERAWVESFPSAEGMTDVLHLLEYIDFARHGITVDPDSVHLVDVESVRAGGEHVGLANLCFESRGANGIEAGHPTVIGLVDGVEALYDRPEISWREMRFGGTVQGSEPPLARVILSGFCLKVRDA